MHATIQTTNIPGRFSWRIIDIVTVAILGVASGVIFYAGDLLYPPLSVALGFTPGLEGLTAGFWLLGPVLAGIIVRKPGAALLASMIGAIVEVSLGSTWGAMNLWLAFVQGLGAEVGLAVFGFVRSRLTVALCAGLTAGLGNAAICLPLYYAGVVPSVWAIYTVSALVSGLVFAGALGYVIAKALVRTGVLSRFPIAASR